MKNKFAATLWAKAGRCREIAIGIQRNLHYSNGAAITLSRLFRRGVPELVYVWDRRLRIVADCRRHEHMAIHEVFVDRTYAPLLDRCTFRDNRIAYVEVGTHIGSFDLWLTTRGLTIDFAITAELNPSTYSRSRRNLESNGLGMIVGFNCAVAQKDGWVDFVPNDYALSDSIYPSDSRLSVPPVRVESLSLSSLIKRGKAAGRRFDLLKLDCEGAEYEILRSAPADLLAAFRYILIEFHKEPAGESLADAARRLKDVGFRTESDLAAPMTFLALFESTRREP